METLEIIPAFLGYGELRAGVDDAGIDEEAEGVRKGILRLPALRVLPAVDEGIDPQVVIRLLKEQVAGVPDPLILFLFPERLVRVDGEGDQLFPLQVRVLGKLRHPFLQEEVRVAVFLLQLLVGRISFQDLPGLLSFHGTADVDLEVAAVADGEFLDVHGWTSFPLQLYHNARECTRIILFRFDKRNTAETAVCTGKIHDGIRRIRPPKVRKMGRPQINLTSAGLSLVPCSRNRAFSIRKIPVLCVYNNNVLRKQWLFLLIKKDNI